MPEHLEIYIVYKCALYKYFFFLSCFACHNCVDQEARISQVSFVGPTSAAVVALVVKVVVEMSDHITDRLLASLRIQRVLDRLRRFHEVVDVDAGTVAEDAPEHARHSKQQRLREQYYGYPLVVADVTLNDTWMTRYGFLVRQVIRSGYPAYLAIIAK